VLTDLRMPGPDGLKVVEIARASGVAAPFLLVTAFPDEQVEASVNDALGVQLLPKPFDAAELAATVTLLLEGAPARDAGTRFAPCVGCGARHLRGALLAEASFCPDCLERPADLGEVFENEEDLGGGD
jgi:DNA-binding response OmpR family regulator